MGIVATLIMTLIFIGIFTLMYIIGGIIDTISLYRKQHKRKKRYSSTSTYYKGAKYER